MGSVISGFVEVVGIADELPENPKYFTEVSVSDILNIPYGNSDMEDILAIAVASEVVSFKVIETLISASNEGQNLSGCKMLVELRLKRKVKYIADEPTKSVRAEHYDNILKSIYVIVPYEIDGKLTSELIRQKKVNVNTYVEDVYVEMRDKRTILNNLTIFIDVKFLGS